MCTIARAKRKQLMLSDLVLLPVILISGLLLLVLEKGEETVGTAAHV